MASNTYVPDRGDVVWLDFDPKVGHEQAGIRPAVVVSPKEYNRPSGLMLVCSITSQVKGYPFEVALPEGIKVNGVVLADQVKCADWNNRKARFICKVPHVILQEVVSKLSTLII